MKEPKYINDVIKCYEELTAGTKRATIATNVGVNPAFVNYVSGITKDIREFDYDMATAKLPANANKRQRILKMLANNMTDRQILEQILDTKSNYIRLVHNVYDVVRKICVPPTKQVEQPVIEPEPVKMEQSHTKGNSGHLIGSNKVIIKETIKTHHPAQIIEAHLNGAVEYLIDNDLLDNSELTGEFPEGRIVERKHKARERNPKVIHIAKENFRRKYGRLICQVCEFDFEKTYGEIGKDFIEGHHITPVSEMKSKHKTKPEEIALLCSNCHRMIHKKRPWLKMTELKEIIKKAKRNPVHKPNFGYAPSALCTNH